jgi:diguanylate cyclase (GGDEF)-like protein
MFDHVCFTDFLQPENDHSEAMKVQDVTARFRTDLSLSALNTVVLVLVLGLLLSTEKQISDTERLSVQTRQFSDALRLASDAGSNSARSYVLTGDPHYRQLHRELHNAGIGGPQLIPLWQRHQLGPHGQQLLAQINPASARLRQLELDAMQLVASADPATDALRMRASLMLQDEAYVAARAALITPLAEFSKLVEERSRTTLKRATNNRAIFQVTLAVLAALFLLLMLRSYRSLHAILGDSSESLFERIAALGNGEFTAARALPAGMENSVAGWLSRTRENLARLDARRRHTLRLEEFRLFVLERLTEKMPLSAILHQIAERIEALLPGRVCSILMVDPDGERLQATAAPSMPDFYNEAIDGVRIGDGVGSCGTTAFSGTATIVENIATDPRWEHYRDLASRAGVAACWSYPIATSKGQVLGTFAIYARTPSVPDQETEQLIEAASDLVALAIDSKRYEDRIQFLAHFDSLTSLPNRVHLREQAHYLLPRADRAGFSVALLFINIDRFMHINDSFGHSVGDSLLTKLAGRLRQTVRDDDTLARFGGDEFVVMLPETDGHGATVVARKLLEAMRQPTCIDQFDLSVTASIGIALYPEDAKDFDELLKQANTAMHRAKQVSSDGFRFYSGEMQALSMRYLKVEAALRAGLERRQLFLQYQPQIDLQSGQVTGAEALLRFHHPELGVIHPDEFIRVAEETGLIQSIGEWALVEAVRQAREWLDAGLPLKTIAVNLSAAQFHHDGLVQRIADVLEQTGLAPQHLELELTESTAMRDPQAAIVLMRELHDRGIGLAIDDFGTGHSSLSCLKRFHLSKLKIDQSFVRDIGTDPDDRAIVGAVINVARALGIRTIAEGVETEEQRRLLEECGCDAVQGFLFSEPLRADAFEAYCRHALYEPMAVG